jgi:predicted nucleic acid binding AN1-type Zn finger protein
MNDGFTIQGMLKGLTPLQMSTKTENDVPPLVLATVSNTKRCGCCSKKLMLSHLGCAKCGTRYCDSHRLPELHACSHDFKKEGQALLAKQNPRVVGDKLERC